MPRLHQTLLQTPHHPHQIPAPGVVRARPRRLLVAVAMAACLPAAAALAQNAGPDTAPDSEVSSGQRVTGHHHTHKSAYSKTSPEQPAPATAQKVAPSARLPDEPNQVKDQVAPVPDAPVRPGTNTAPPH